MKIIKHIYNISALLLLTLIIISCNKDTKKTDPLVEIFSPEHKQPFLLPDTINIKFGVTCETEIEYVKVSIVNKNMIPISEQEFLYPETSNYNGNIYLSVNLLTESVNSSPFYVKITVSNFSQVNQTYREIDLMNNKIKYDGCFLIGKNGINTSNISYFNNQYQKIYSTDIVGNYTDSDISINSNMMYLITNTPDKAIAIDCENGETTWTKDPQLPYPQFNRVLVNNNIVYFSTAIGRIIGLTDNEGIQIFNTLVLPDSIPVNLCITDDFLIADTKLRNSGSRVWVTYYIHTGSKYQMFPTNNETVKIFNFENNNVVVFCNNNSTGQIIIYNAETNIIENNLIINNIEIQQSCKINKTNFLFSSTNKLYHFDLINQSYTKIMETEDNIIDIKFDHINSQLFVLQINKLETLSYPELNNIGTIETSYPLYRIELKYSY